MHNSNTTVSFLAVEVRHRTLRLECQQQISAKPLQVRCDFVITYIKVIFVILS